MYEVSKPSMRVHEPGIKRIATQQPDRALIFRLERNVYGSKYLTKYLNFMQVSITRIKFISKFLWVF